MGAVKAIQKGPLIQFNYTPKAEREGRWNYFERISRGLIMNAQSGAVVARPFDKFFGWSPGAPLPQDRLVSVTEKLDGSLGILYRHQGSYKIATRGSFDSPQASWATQRLAQHKLEGLDPQLTLMFELIYPQNRVLVDYGDREALVLIGGRDMESGQRLSLEARRSLAQKHGFEMPQVYDFDQLEDLLATQTTDLREGWVAELEGGELIKVKTAAYLKALRKTPSSPQSASSPPWPRTSWTP